MANGKDLDDPLGVGFEPCRDERCDLDYLHPAHTKDFVTKGNRFFRRTCPNCSAILIKLPGRRGRCSVCSWRGRIEQSSLDKAKTLKTLKQWRESRRLEKEKTKLHA